MTAPWAEAALAEVVLDGSPLTEAAYYAGTLSRNIDSKMNGFVALCAVVGKLQKISLAGCGLGPASMGELAKAISCADAALTNVVITGAAIGESHVAALRAAAPTGCEVVW